MLAAILPRLVASELSVLPPRLVSEDAAKEAAGVAGERAKFDAGTEYARQLDVRASKFLDPAVRNERRAAEMAAADFRLSDATERFQAAIKKAELASADAASAEVPTRLLDANLGGELLEYPGISAGASAKAKALDLLVFGTIEPQSGYAAVVLNGYDAALDRIVFSWTGSCSPSDPAPLAVDYARKIERWVAGRDFARLELDVSPRASDVYVDGRELGEKERVIYSFSAGRMIVEAEAEGFKPRKIEEAVSLGERRRLGIDLERASTGLAHITSEPDGAFLSIDALRSGAAPLDIPLTGRRTFVTAKKDGFEEQTIILPAKGDLTITIKLRPQDGLGPGGRVKKAKDEFYTSLGYLVLAIPVTAVSTGVYNSYLEAAPRSLLDSRLVTGYNVSSVILGTTAVATAALAVNAIIRLVHYLGAAK
jgi:hypothetical protein